MPSEPRRASREGLPLLVLISLVLVLLFLGGAAKVVIVSVLFSFILSPVVDAIESRGAPRGIATLAVLGAIIGCLVLAGYRLAPVIAGQLRSMQSGETSARILESILQVQEGLRGYLEPLGLGDLRLVEQAESAKRHLAGNLVGALARNAFSHILAAVTVPFMMFFLLMDGRELKKAFIAHVPNRHFEFAMDLIHKMELQLGSFLRSQFADALAFGVLSSLTLWLLGVPYFLLLGAFAGIANLIPYVGPLAGALLGCAVAVLNSGSIAAGFRVIAAFAFLKILDDFLMQPFFVSRGVRMHPLCVLVAIMVGGGLFGILGMLIAVPAAGFLQVAFCESLATWRKYRVAA